MFQQGFYCKMKINGSAGLNGKVNVQILDVEDTNLMVFQMPTDFADSYGSHGILENN